MAYRNGKLKTGDNKGVLSVASWGASGLTEVLEDLSPSVSSEEDGVGASWASGGELVESHAETSGGDDSSSGRL